MREDAPWLRGGPDVQYRYEQRVSFLCAGLDGPGRSFLEAKWPVRAVNVIDMKPYLRVPVDRFLGAGTLQLEDLMGMSLDDFESCDGLIAGPPCQAVSMFGKGLCGNDPRTQVFFKVLEVIENLSKRSSYPLKWVILENVCALTYCRSHGNVLSYITEWWSQHMPHWGPLRAQKMNANTCGLPQSRARLIMASESNIFQDIAGIPSVPRVLPKVSFEIWLESGAPLSGDLEWRP